MANNPNVNKVVYGNQTVMDITDTTAEPQSVLEGEVFYDRSGTRQTGTAIGGIPEEELRDTVGWTGKNLLPYPYVESSKTLNGITYTINADGSILVNGTSTAESSLNLRYRLSSNVDAHPLMLKQGTYVISKGTDNTDVRFRAVKTVNGAVSEIITITEEEGSFSLDSEYQVGCQLIIPNGKTISNVTVYPMFRYSAISDPTYEPYHESVKQVLRDGEVIEGKNLLPYPNRGTRQIIANDGTISDNDDLYLTDYIDVSGIDSLYFAAKTIRGSVLFRFDYYDSSKNFIERVNRNLSTTTQTELITNHPGTKYIRVNFEDNATNGADIPCIWNTQDTNTTIENYYIPLKDSKFDRSEQRVLGAKNFNNSHYVTTTDKGITYTANSDGSISVAGTATADSYNNSDAARRFEAPFTGQVILSGGASGGVYLYPYDYTLGSRPYIDSSLTTKQTGDITTSDGELSFYMQEGHSLLINMRVLNGTAIPSAVTLKPMLRLASDPDDTYAPYAKTNKELTDIVKNVPQEIVRTGVTATAGTAVRIPASGTDSRISTANTCVVKPISKAKSDGTPYKYTSCKVYSGYVEITYAENISNIAVGVEVVNY